MYFHPLNFIRFILAIGVILFHYGVNYYPFDQPGIRTLIVNSSFRVSFFFFISGFVMSMVYAKQVPGLSAGFFYKRRFTRIFPLYWLAFLLTLLGVLFLNGASPKGLNIILHALGLQSLNPGHVLDLNYPTWSISVELVFYLVCPFLLRWMVKLSLRQLFFVSCTAWVLQSLQHIFFVEWVYNGTKVSEEFISTFPLWHLPTFFLGMITAHLISLKEKENAFTAYPLLFLLLALLVFAYIIFVPNPVLKYVHNGLLSPLFMVIVLSLYYDRSFIHRILSNKHISDLGNLSYGLFIFQYPVWLLCTKIASPDFIRTSWFFVIYVMVLLLFAKIINLVFEKPVLKWLRR